VKQQADSLLAASLWLCLPLVYVPEWFKILILCGSEFSAFGNGWPLVAALLLPAAGELGGRRVPVNWVQPLAAVGALAGVLLYTGVHADGFNEQSPWGSLALALLGLVLGCCRARLTQPSAQGLRWAALPIALAHLLSLRYAHAPLLLLALLLAVAADHLSQSPLPDRRSWQTQKSASALWGYLLASPLYAGGLGDSAWALHFALAPVALALGALCQPAPPLKRPALCLPAAGVAALALFSGVPYGGLGLLLNALAALALGRQWGAGRGAPSAFWMCLGFGLAYLESQRSSNGLLLLLLVLVSLFDAWPRSGRRVLAPAA
jgi:hypothetical protein